jgi:hypothetical protein
MAALGVEAVGRVVAPAVVRVAGRAAAWAVAPVVEPSEEERAGARRVEALEVAAVVPRSMVAWSRWSR